MWLFILLGFKLRSYHERFGCHIAHLKLEMGRDGWKALVRIDFPCGLFLSCVCVREALPESPFAAKSEDLAPKSDLELFKDMACQVKHVTDRT